MDPAEGNEVILVLHIKDLFFTERLTWVGTSRLLGDDDVGHPQGILWLCECVKKWRCVKREVGEVYNHKGVGWSWMGWGVRCVRGMVLTVQAPLSLQSLSHPCMHTIQIAPIAPPLPPGTFLLVVRVWTPQVGGSLHSQQSLYELGGRRQNIQLNLIDSQRIFWLLFTKAALRIENTAWI